MREDNEKNEEQSRKAASLSFSEKAFSPFTKEIEEKKDDYGRVDCGKSIFDGAYKYFEDERNFKRFYKSFRYQEQRLPFLLIE